MSRWLRQIWVPGRRIPLGPVIAPLLAICLTLGVRVSGADEFLLADAQLWPGEIFTSDGHRAERRIFRLRAERLPEGKGSVPRIAGIAAGRADEIYFCSGLDGHIHRWNRTTGELKLLYTHMGQVRDLCTHPKTDELYFSEVPTPERGEPLSGGAVYRFDRRAAAAQLACAVDQTALDRSWHGALALSGARLYLATQGAPSRVVRVEGKELVTVFKTADFCIHGLAFADERLLLLSGDGRLLEAIDDEHAREVAQYGHNFTNLAALRHRPAAEGEAQRAESAPKP